MRLLGVYTGVLEVIQLRLWLAFATENPLAKPPRDLFSQLERSMLSCGDPEHIIKLFQCPLLCFGQKEQDHEKGKHVEACVKATDARQRTDNHQCWLKHLQCAGRSERGEHARQRHRQDGSPKVVRCDCPRHANFSVAEWEDFSRVCERHWSFSRRIECSLYKMSAALARRCGGKMTLTKMKTKSATNAM